MVYGKIKRFKRGRKIMAMPKAHIDIDVLNKMMANYQSNKYKRANRKKAEEEYRKATGYLYSYGTLYRYWKGANIK